MATKGYKRKISAILSADVVGYSRLMEDSEAATVSTLEAYRETITSIIEQHRGRLIDSVGDNILSEFASVVDAVECAVEIQQVIRAKNADLPENRKMAFRIGVNLGDVIEEGDRIYGEGVNLASRIEAMADPGSIYMSGSAYDQIKSKLALGYEDLGERSVKNITEPVRVYRIPVDSGSAAGAVKGRISADRRRLNIAVGVIAVLIIFLTAIITRNFVLKPSPSQITAGQETATVPTRESQPATAAKPSIAVLPFDNMSDDPEQEYFSDSITEEIISRLSKNSMLTVIARNSTFTYKGKAVKVQQVAQELGVKHVLEGSVLKADNRVRITAQLVDAVTGGHLWSETYQRELRDVFAIQAEIAQNIAAALRAEYKEAELARVMRIPTASLTAYDAYWRGYGHFVRLTSEDLARAREYFERAIELDPNYPDAYAWLAIAYTQGYSFRWDADPKVLDKAFDLTRKALSLDSSSSAAHKAQSFIYSEKGQCELALSKAKKVISIDPNSSSGYNVMGIARACLGRFEEAIESYTETIRLDPHGAYGHNNISVVYRATLRFEEAIAARMETIALNPDHPISYSSLAGLYVGQWYHQKEQNPKILDSALEMAEKCAELDERSLYCHGTLSDVYLARKQHSLAVAAAEKAIAVDPDTAEGYAFLSNVYSHAGRLDEAVEMAEKADGLFAPRSPWRFRTLGKAYGLSGHLTEAIAAYRKALDSRPSLSDAYEAHLGLTILYVDMDRLDEAKAEAQQVLEIVPHFSVDVWGQRIPYKDPALADRDVAALREAGLK